MRLLALPIAVVMATGAVAASAISDLRNGAPIGDESGTARSVGSPLAPGGVAVSGRAPTAGSSPAVVDPGAQPARPPRVVYRGSATGRVVALTFDDGWSATNGHAILQILLREHVKATFFVNGVFLALDPGLWRSIAGAGFVVGNHTYLHHDVTKMTGLELMLDLQRNARVWEAVTGTKMAPLFRPPYESRNAATDLAAARAGYPDVILWDTGSGDTGRGSDAQLIRNATRGRPGSIVLMHIGPDATPRILERVIASYRARGFTFVTVPELLPPFLPARTPSPSPGTPVSSPATLPAGARPPEIVLHRPA
jgi:peptidoglycan/xylan/chitin deacetylase (PgdA/CDA1 family)